MQILYRQAPVTSESPQEKQVLLETAIQGSEIALFIDNSRFPEWLLFDGAIIVNGHYYGWTSPNVGQGRRLPTLDRKHNEIVRCVYGTDGSTTVIRRCIRTGAPRNDIYRPVNVYRAFSWVQLSKGKACTDREAGLNPHRVKCMLEFGNAKLIFKPTIVYFGDNAAPGDAIASLKSSEISVPGNLVSLLTGDPTNDGYYDMFIYGSKDDGSRVIITRQDRKAEPIILHTSQQPILYLSD